jgi:DNA mismatch repair ATPase MutS
MMEERMKRDKVPKSSKCVNREVCNMVTKGTYISKEQTYEAKYILSIKRFGNEFGVTFFDVTTLKLYIGQFSDDESMSSLRTLVSQIRPVEVIHENEFSNSEVIKMLKNSPMVPVMSPMPPVKCFSFIRTCTELERYFG